jgi:hypothetical protein
MPQFDLSSFFVQYFWLFLSLIITYTLLCVYFLPVTSKYIKSRRRIFSTPEAKVFTYLPVTINSIRTKKSSKNFIFKAVIF